ncbi:MAG: acyl carrier protein [Candidatus Binatia bacterium]
MDEAAIWQTLTDVFRDTLGDDTIRLRPETTAQDVDGWDSVTHIQLLVAVERAFGIRFNTGEVAGLANVGALVRLIGRRAR